MSRLARDGTVEPVSRDQILRHARGQGNFHFPCSADHEQDWQPYPVDPYSAICHDHTYIHTYIHFDGFRKAFAFNTNRSPIVLCRRSSTPVRWLRKIYVFFMFAGVFLRVVLRRESTLEMFAAAYGVVL